jgi:FXSXX-COOH protein
MLCSDIEVCACVFDHHLGECVVEQPAASTDAGSVTILDRVHRRPLSEIPADVTAAVVSRVVRGRQDRAGLAVAAFNSSI